MSAPTAEPLTEALMREPEQPLTPPGNPTIAGLPGFVIGSVALALQTSGYISPAAGAVILPITFGASAVSTLLAAVWGARLGQDAVACIFATFTGFWISYSILIMGVTHGWFSIPPAETPQAVSVFLICWLVLVLCLTAGSLRLPLAFTLTFVLVDLHIALNIVNVLTGSDILICTLPSIS